MRVCVGRRTFYTVFAILAFHAVLDVKGMG